MIIVIVVDTFIGARRGVPLAAVKLHKLLTEAGHEVRVVACGKSTSTYRVHKLWIPYFSFIAQWQGISYGKPEEDVLIKALEGADIVHLMLPFSLEKKAEFLARRFSVPVVASFGTTAHGFLNILGFGWCTPASGIVYRLLRFSLYKKCKNIICHSQQICDDLRKYKYSAKLHVIDESEFEDSSAVPKVIAAYAQAIADDEVTYADKSRQIFKRNWAIFPSSIDVANPYKKNRLFFRIWYTISYYWTIVIAAVGSFVLFGLRVEGKKNLRSVKGGAITVSNHIHNVDSAMLAVSMAPQRITFTSIEGNFKLPVVRWLIKWVGVVPIPSASHLLRDFFSLTVQHLQEGKKIHFYPEGSLWQYYTGIRPFKKGAFHMAINAGVPVIPAVLVQRPCTGLRRLFRKKSLFKVIICPAVYANPALSGVRQIDEMRDRTYEIMCKALDKDQYDQHRESEYETSCSTQTSSTSLLDQNA